MSKRDFLKTGLGVLAAPLLDATPDEAVAVMPQPGLPALDKTPTDQPVVQVLVRGGKRTPMGGYERARAIYDALHCLDGVLLDDGGRDLLDDLGLRRVLRVDGGRIECDRLGGGVFGDHHGGATTPLCTRQLGGDGRGGGATGSPRAGGLSLGGF